MTITFELSHQLIHRTDHHCLASGSQNYVYAKFDLLTDDWAAPITAVFGNYSVILNSENQCLVPWEVLTSPGTFSVSAFCADLHTATCTPVTVHPSGYIEGQTPQPPTPSVYAELTDMVQQAVDTANSVQQRADAGEFNGPPGEPGPQGPKGQDGTVSFSDLSDQQKQSLQGKSAYAHAQEGGFTGTEEEFAAKLAAEYPSFANLREAAPVNLLDNSNFTQFVAQAGLGGNHGSTVYAGDRWVLTNGTIAGSANSNGNGYTDISITHNSGNYCDLMQKTPLYSQLEGQPCTAAVEYADGSKYIANFNMGQQGGAIPIGEMEFYSIPGNHFIFRVKDSETVSIKHLWAVPGTYTEETMPEYRPKGYAGELLECQRYYIPIQLKAIAGYVGSTLQNATFKVQLPSQMRVKPTISIGIADSLIGLDTSGSPASTPVTNVTANDGGPFMSLTIDFQDKVFPQWATVFSFGSVIYAAADL